MLEITINKLQGVHVKFVSLRPRKPPSQLMARVLRDDDPCLGSAAGHAALPVLMPSRLTAAGMARTQNQVRTVLVMLF